MLSAVRRLNGAAGAGVVLGLAMLAGCSSGGAPAAGTGSIQVRPESIVAAPKDVLSAGEPQPNGTMWMLAGGPSSRGLFEFDLDTGQSVGSVPVSGAAQAVTQSLTGVIGLALGAGKSGALQLLNGGTATVTKTIPLGAPARGVVAGADGTTFYVLDGTASSASVTIVDSVNGRVLGTVPVPLDTVSVAPDSQQSALYTLQPNGLVSQIAVAGGKMIARFPVGKSGGSLALSPDGSTLYALKNVAGAANVAVVNLATDSVRQALPAPAHCVQVLVSADGSHLYELVGTPEYGNIQVFGA